MNTHLPERTIDFAEVMSSLLGLLTSKEKSIIERRYLAQSEKKETLESIGKSYSITRERVRQIESVAIKKLARISLEPSVRYIHELAYSILINHGKVMSEDLLVSEMLKKLKNSPNMNIEAMKLAIHVSDKMIKQERNQIFRPFWYTRDIDVKDIKKAIKDIRYALAQQGSVLPLESLSSRLFSLSPERTQSLLHIHWGFLKTSEGWGLKTWRTINPRSIKDKILVTLKKIQKPLHFNDIVLHVLQDFDSPKKVTPQAIHNDLIRHEEFVLVGRGLYGLKEWDLPAGTVCDIIVSVLKESKSPMKRQDIIKKVLKKRQIRVGTISLNLQKYPFFKRVGRAVYEYNAALDKRKRKRS